MKTALEMLKEREANPPPIVIETIPAAGLVDKFFSTGSQPLRDTTPTGYVNDDGTPYFRVIPPVPDKPVLPSELLPFCYLHRTAATGGMPADKAAQVLEAIHSVADMLPNKHKRGLLIEARMETLQELSDWFLTWMPPEFQAGEDPFEGI